MPFFSLGFTLWAWKIISQAHGVGVCLLLQNIQEWIYKISSNDPKINYVNESSNSQLMYIGSNLLFLKDWDQKKKKGWKKKKKNKDKTNFFIKTPTQSNKYFWVT